MPYARSRSLSAKRRTTRIVRRPKKATVTRRILRGRGAYKITSKKGAYWGARIGGLLGGAGGTAAGVAAGALAGHHIPIERSWSRGGVQMASTYGRNLGISNS